MKEYENDAINPKTNDVTSKVALRVQGEPKMIIPLNAVTFSTECGLIIVSSRNVIINKK